MYTYTALQLEQKTFGQLKAIAREFGIFPAADRRCRQNWIDAIVGFNPPLLQLLEVSPAASAVEQVQPIIETLETPSAVEVEPVQMLPIESKFGRIVYPQPAQKPIVQSVENLPAVDPGVDVDRALEPIAQVAKNSPGVEVDPVEESIVPVKNFPGSRSKASITHQLLELFQSTAHIIEDSPGVKTEATVSESAIVPAVKTSFDAQSDRNPILTGILLSDKFLARYFPPQSENIRFQSEADGQLSLFNFEVVTESEPPDPDDFESLDVFREAIALWDAQNPEPPAVSLDSMCEWAPCPEEWYEPKAEILPLKASFTIELPEQSSVIELLIDGGSFIICNFFIPTFGRLSDRSDRSDEPPDTGIYATLPKPKPPSFFPTVVSQARVKRGLNAYQTHTKCIPKVSRMHTHCIVVGSSTQPARSPPGGDACLV